MANKLLFSTLMNVSLAGLYIFGISQFLFYGEKIFNATEDSNLAPFLLLLLFSLSAAVVGSLIFGQAVIFFLENKRLEGIKSAFYSIGWLFLFTLIIVVALVLIK